MRAINVVSAQSCLYDNPATGAVQIRFFRYPLVPTIASHSFLQIRFFMFACSYVFLRIRFFRFVSSDLFLHICLFISCWMRYLFLWIRFFRFIWSDSFCQICLFIFGSLDCIVQICFFRFMIIFFASSCLLCGAVVLRVSLLQSFARCVSWLRVCACVCAWDSF